MQIHPQSTTRWPIPSVEPLYVHRTQDSRTHTWHLYDVVASIFAALGLVFLFWFGALVLDRGLPGEPFWVVFFVLFWALSAYLAFPRLHQIISTIYVPNYFIGRTRTSDGILGDPVNLAFNGTASDVHCALRQAGWVQAEPLTAHSAWKIVVASILRKSYPQAPVSHLFLFDRQEDFAYEREVAGNPARRHHARFWKTPAGWTLPGGIEVDWVAATTYDRSVGLSLFTGQITHKIDAHIDAERDYLIETLLYGSAHIRVGVIERYFNAYHSRNGGGDAIRTDGDLPIVEVTTLAQDEGVTSKTNTLPTTAHVGDDEFDVEDSKPSFSQRELPPHQLWLVAMLIVANAIANTFVHELSIHYVGLASLVSLFILVLIARHHLWAWVLMLIVQSCASVFLLISASSETWGFLMQTGFQVLSVFVLSANPVRLWVTSRRRKDQTDEDNRNFG